MGYTDVISINTIYMSALSFWLSRWLFIIAVCIAGVTPSLIRAEEISQTFPEPFIYFPMEENSAVIYADGAFYDAGNVAENQLWQDTGTRFNGLDEYMSFEFLSKEATYFEGYSYIAAESDNPTADNFDGSTAMEQVWRLGRNTNDELTFDLVFEINVLEVPSTFKNLMVFGDRLYALSYNTDGTEVVLWRTSNGSNWKKVTASGLPEFDGSSVSYKAFSSGKTGYLGLYDANDDIAEYAIYKSTNGADWEEMTGEYNDAALLSLDGPYGIAGMDRIASQLYAVIASGYGYQGGGYYATSVWYKNGNGDWREAYVGTDDRIIDIVATKKNAYLVTTASNRTSIAKCNRKLTGCSTEKLDGGSSVVGSFRLGKRAVFIVNSDDGYTLFRP